MTDELDDTIYNIYDRDGKLISEDIYRVLIEDPNYIKFRHSLVITPLGEEYLVITNWRGIDFATGVAGKPLIFETQVYEVIERDEELGTIKVKAPHFREDALPFDYYSDEFEAWVGHDAIVQHMRKTIYE